jgi:two-component system, response regulator PdtaR
MSSALILCDAGDAQAILETDLKRIGMHLLGATSCERLVQDTIRLEPDCVVILVAAPDPALFSATALLESLHPVPVAAFTEDAQAESIERALGSGIHAWIVRGYSGERLRPVLQLAQLRFRREKQQRESLAQLASRLEERKLVDRAKGILMSTRRMAEDEAFHTLREAAMHGKQRVGQVAQRLIDAARSAEAINRAGQLRMLAQRLVKLHLLGALGVEPQSAEALRRVSVDRCTQNLAALADLVSTATFGDLLDACVSAWRGLKIALARDGQAAAIGDIDLAAERLLDAAERLTAALESASPIATMQLVNLAGRQRMLTQRVAKLALLDSISPVPERERLAAQLAQAAADFEKAMATLRRSTRPAPREPQLLLAAERAWANLRYSAAHAQAPEQRLAIAQTSEELVEIFDQLTESHEHSLEVLVG